MSDVVEERGGDQGVARTGRGRQCGHLQRVVELGDILVVRLTAEAVVEIEDLVEIGHRTGLPWKSPMSETGTRSSSGATASSAVFCR